MSILPKTIDDFFFARRSATPFGLMRIVWALVTGMFLLFQWKYVTYYYSNNGILPWGLMHIAARSDWYFSVLRWVTTPDAVFALYLGLIACLTCMLLGIFPRLSTVLSVLLLFSFHERNNMVLGGGDTLLRDIGFILMVSPGISAISLSRARKGWKHWKKTGTFLPPLTMPAWPYRLLLWQILIVYITSLWYKLLGNLWTDGTATIITLHHPIYSRLPKAIADELAGSAVLANNFLLIWEASWALLLIPKRVLRWIWEPLEHFPLKRIQVLAGFFFHGSILFMMDAGVFSLAVFTSYMGIIDRSDLDALAHLFHERSPFLVFYDGHCGLCRRSVFVLEMLDSFHLLKLVDFRDAAEHKKFAADVSLAALDRALHIKRPDGRYLNGFDAFRELSWHLPALWILIPLLYFPGVPRIGRGVYAFIAKRRKRCTHKDCRL